MPPDAERSDTNKSYFLADRLGEAINEVVYNEYLHGALNDIRGHLARVRRHAHSNPRRLEQATAEHVLIVDAILRGDEFLAVQATAVHLRNSLDNILSTITRWVVSLSLPSREKSSDRSFRKRYPKRRAPQA